MSFLNSFKRRKDKLSEKSGLVLFMDVQKALKAEKILKNAGYEIKLVAPPPELREGCDLAIAINLVEKPGIERRLDEKKVKYIEVIPLKIDTSNLLEVVKIKDFGNNIMVKAGNMKLTFNKNNGIIVNISGGGCPDIPYLYSELINKLLEEAPRPKNIGFTLCALMLDIALNESLTLWRRR